LLFPLAAKKKGLVADVEIKDNVFLFKDVIKNSPPSGTLPVNISFNDIAQYQYTGGTTGVSKGVILTHGNLSKNVQQIAAWFPKLKQGKEVMLGALPF